MGDGFFRSLSGTTCPVGSFTGLVVQWPALLLMKS